MLPYTFHTPKPKQTCKRLSQQNPYVPVRQRLSVSLQMTHIKCLSKGLCVSKCPDFKTEQLTAQSELQMCIVLLCFDSNLQIFGGHSLASRGPIKSTLVLFPQSYPLNCVTKL